MRESAATASAVGSLSIVHAIKWSFLSELASKAVTPFVFVVLARLLTPEDYGVVAAATMVISFSQVFWEAGMAKALVQFQGDREKASNVAFWVNCFLGLAVALVLFASADLVARTIFHDERVAQVLQALCLHMLLTAVSSTHAALLQKDLQFKQLFWVRLLTVTVPGLISIPLAWSGYGYWALVAGLILGQTVQVIVLWRFVQWRPTFSLDRETFWRLSRFGAWVAASGLSAWFYLWADSLIVGSYLGTRELGLYRTGNAFVLMVYGVLFGPLLPVLYSYLSSIQGDRNEVSTVLTRVVKSITFISVPTGMLLFALSEPTAQLVFGDAWRGVGLVVAVLGMTHGLAWMVGANGEAYRAIGRPDCEAKIMAGALPVYAFGYWLGVQYGFTAFLWTRLGMSLFGIALHLVVARAVIGLAVAQSLMYVLKVAIAGIPLLALSQFSEHISRDVVASINAPTILAAAWLFLCLWLLEKNGLIREFTGAFMAMVNTRLKS